MVWMKRTINRRRDNAVNKGVFQEYELGKMPCKCKKTWKNKRRVEVFSA